jgi:outer membrane protein OmpA-like peptidoglycan-associated protein
MGVDRSHHIRRSESQQAKVNDMSSLRQRPVPLPRRLAIAVGLCAALPVLAQAQVTYFQRPPTPEQLRAALLTPSRGSATPAAPSALGRGGLSSSGSRARGIVWQSAGGGASGSPASAAPSSTQAAPVAVASTAGQLPRASLYEPANAATGAPAAALPINFDLGSSRVDRDSLPYIETIASLLRGDPSLRLVIEGHTDALGSYHRNMILSWDRALGVFRTLVESYGVEPQRLQLLGKGPLEPMPGTDPTDGANRRVQFRISG